MLVLTRRPGESIIIELPTGEQIKVIVLALKGNQVRIGTAAPPELTILREELLEPDPGLMQVSSLRPTHSDTVST